MSRAWDLDRSTSSTLVACKHCGARFVSSDHRRALTMAAAHATTDTGHDHRARVDLEQLMRRQEARARG